MIITTLPISPLPSRPFLSLATVLYSDIIARCLDAPLKLSWDVLGQRYWKAKGSDASASLYRKSLSSIGGQNKSADLQKRLPRIRSFVEERVSRLLSDDRLKMERMEISCVLAASLKYRPHT